LSRNQVRYSVAPQGHFAYLFNVSLLYDELVCGCKYRNKCVTCKHEFI
jgi:hypothetical protein